MSEQVGDDPSTIEDRRSMAEFYGCSEAAFLTLENRWRRRLFGFFRRLGAGIEDAEDLTIETLVKLYVTKERTSFDLGEPLAPFLFRVARNVYVAWWRGVQGKQPPVAAPDDPSEPHPELSADLLECIEGLPLAEREYVLLCGKHGLGELSHNEIAERLHKWRAQVTQLSQRTRTRLLQCMRAKGYQ